MTIDFTKPVQTKDGQPARILCTDAPDREYPVVGYIGGDSYPSRWTADGRFLSKGKSACDLENTKVQHEYWINIWEASDGRTYLEKFLGLFSGKGETRRFHPSKREAELYAGDGKAIQAKVTWEE